VQILVVVANIQVRTLKAEVEKGFMGSAFHHELIDPKPDRECVGRRQSGRKVHFRLSPRVKGKQVNIPVSGLGFIRQRK
jgi:hypothetical protein